ncbi:LapA family protein [Thalassobacillus sp. B23F22_16]|uniref:LapA family protein n=1 Tax=Thalassobacillus sp. B23F22_16 TaxID=3459513 RepID=UPI00373E2924
MKGQYYWILALIFALLIAIFAVINVDPVEVNFIFGTGEWPLILVILISALLGGIVTAAAGSVRFYQLQREVKKLRSGTKGKTPAGRSEHQSHNRKHDKQRSPAADDTKHKS